MHIQELGQIKRTCYTIERARCFSQQKTGRNITQIPLHERRT